MLRLHHLALKAKDPDSLSRFYCSVLGLEELRRHEDDRGLRSVWLALGNTILMVERSESGAAPSNRSDDPPGLHLIALAIDPRDAPSWRQRISVVRETAYTLYFLDPEGNRIGLSSWPESLSE